MSFERSRRAPLLQARGLRLDLPGPAGWLRVLDGIDLTVAPGQTLGLVGESGSGKTMFGLSVMGLLPRGARLQADMLRFAEHDLVTASDRQRRQLRGSRVAMIFQDPMTSLNPYLCIRDQLAEMLPNDDRDPAEVIERALAAVQLADPARCARSYPHQLSGGMRQRVLIAMMLLAEPDLLIADEPTTALDVTVQAEILRLLRALVAQRGLAMILVSHDLAVVASVADTLAVMYAGRVVEVGDVRAVLERPAHPYTAALLASRPGSQPRAGPLRVISGQVPLAGSVPGCPFAPRCAFALTDCAHPVTSSPAAHGGSVTCHRNGQWTDLLAEPSQ